MNFQNQIIVKLFQQIPRGPGNWKHKPLIDTKLSCDLCKYQTMKKPHLAHHMKAVHFSEASKCEICQTIFGNEFKLKIHIKQVHVQQMFQCMICKVKFKAYHSHCLHMERFHPTKKLKMTFACDLCGKGFYVKPYIDMHIKRYHQGPYKCFVITCKKGFADSNMRKKHYRTTHQGNDEVKQIYFQIFHIASLTFFSSSRIMDVLKSRKNFFGLLTVPMNPALKHSDIKKL